jgi:hypothetical protein
VHASNVHVIGNYRYQSFGRTFSQQLPCRFRSYSQQAIPLARVDYAYRELFGGLVNDPHKRWIALIAT